MAPMTLKRDEIRFKKDKRTLNSIGHNSPKVILEEHSNIMRMPSRVRNDFLRYRTLPHLEAPAYAASTDGKFLYGKGMSGSKSLLSKLMADSSKDTAVALADRNRKLFSRPDLIKYFKSLL
jgi:hypothetical protein